MARSRSARRAARALEELYLQASERALVDVNGAVALGVGPDRIEAFLRCEGPGWVNTSVCDP